jgi:hypothetical protein
MPTYAPNVVFVPCLTGTGVTVNQPDQTLYGRRWKPQPFLSYLERINLTETWFPDGYVGHLYNVTQNFDRTPVVSIVAGALPPGLGLSVGANALTITGTPTSVGIYDFTIRFVSGVVATDYLNHITINEDPDEGVGAVGGG